MKILVTGGTGFLGSYLVEKLSVENQCVVLTRDFAKARSIFSSSVKCVEWRKPLETPLPQEALQGVQAVIHLAGESLSNGLWTASKKNNLYRSRVLLTQNLVKALNLCPSIECFISASAVGFYGNKGEQNLTESSCRGEGFLSELCENWEREASLAMVKRVCVIRTGLVLAARGGVLPELLLPFKMYLGSVFGSGRQWMSWIHIDDWVRALTMLLQASSMSGAYNIVSPNPVRNLEFSKTLGHVLQKSVFLRTPQGVLKLLLGAKSQLLLSSQKVFPKKLLDKNFKFKFSKLDEALRSCV